jgi:transposase
MRKPTRSSKRTLKKTKDFIDQFKTDPTKLTFFFDEGRFGLMTTLQRMWAEKGKPLSVTVKQGYQAFYTYSSVAPHSGDAFSLLLPEVNTEMMNIYLNELATAHHDKAIILFMDQAGWHKANNLKVPDNITIKFLPPYSPELNPVEKLWQWLKKETYHNVIYQTLTELANAIEKEMIHITKEQFKSICHCSYL